MDSKQHAQVPNWHHSSHLLPLPRTGISASTAYLATRTCCMHDGWSMDRYHVHSRWSICSTTARQCIIRHDARRLVIRPHVDTSFPHIRSFDTSPSLPLFIYQL